MHNLIYLNNAATTYPKSPLALNTFYQALTDVPMGVRHGNNDHVFEAKEKISKYLNVLPSNIIFSSGATLAINQVIFGYLKEKEHCIVDNRSHTSVLRALHNYSGIEYSICSLYSKTEKSNIDILVNTIKKNTKLICLNQVSNVLGTIYDIAAIISKIKMIRPDIAVFVDASQSIGTTDLSVLKDADFWVFPAHKHLYSPDGIAVIVAKKELVPLFYGSTGIDSNVLGIKELKSEKFEVGTQNWPSIAALTAAVEEVYTMNDSYKSHEKKLTQQLWEGLNGIPGIELLGLEPCDMRIGIISCSLRLGTPEADWAPFLRSQKIIVRGGLHCAPTLHKELGIETIGTLRFSLGRYNNEKEIKEVIEIIKIFSSSLDNIHN
jgi:cysteine desulfurase/selenocysteine lyase